jgi:hypothetical protein
MASIFRCIEEPLLAVVEEQPNILSLTLIPLTETQVILATPVYPVRG